MSSFYHSDNLPDDVSNSHPNFNGDGEPCGCGDEECEGDCGYEPYTRDDYEADRADLARHDS